MDRLGRHRVNAQLVTVGYLLSDAKVGQSWHEAPPAVVRRVMFVGNPVTMSASTGLKGGLAMDDPNHPHAVPEWTIDLSETGNVLLRLGHAPTPEDYMAGRVQWAYLVLTPQQAQSLARDLLRTEGRSPQMMGEEI
jgi:hypothetical protein